MIEQILWFLPWCWFVNMSFNILVGLELRVPQFKPWNAPVDGSLLFFDGNRILGDSSTWLGLLQAIVLGLIGKILFPGHGLLLIALLVWLGHALGSFVKRRLGMKRGAFLPVVDHGDSVILAGTVSYVLGFLTIETFIVAVLLTLILTPLITRIGYMLGMRLRPI